MNPLRHLLLVVALVLAQLAGTAHALEHVMDDAGVAPGHSCALCLAAQDLGAALPASAPVLATAAPVLPVPVPIPAGRSAVPPPPPSQRGPPAA